MPAPTSAVVTRRERKQQRQGAFAPCHYQRITHQGACGKAPGLPQTARPCLRMKGRDERSSHCRKRADGPDAGRGTGVGGGRCGDSRTAPDAGAGGLGWARVPLPNDRDPRPAWHRRPVPCRGEDRRPCARRQRHGPQRLPHPASLHAGAGAGPHRADPARLGRGAGGADPSRGRGDRLRSGRRRRGRAPCRWRADPDGLPGRGRRRAQCHPQGGRHRVRRVGCDSEPPDRRGRGDRGDADRYPARRDGRPRAERLGGRADRAGWSRPSNSSGPPPSRPWRSSASR